LVVMDVTDGTATISWESTSATHFMIQIRAIGGNFTVVDTYAQTFVFTLSSLSPLTQYEVRIYAGVGGNYESIGSTISFTTLEEITTEPPFTTPPSTTPIGSDESPANSLNSNLGLVIGAAVAGLIAILLIVAAILFIVKRKKKNNLTDMDMDHRSHISE